jgi:hypothetical protein
MTLPNGVSNPTIFGNVRKRFLHRKNIEGSFCILKWKEFADSFIQNQ